MLDKAIHIIGFVILVGGMAFGGIFAQLARAEMRGASLWRKTFASGLPAPESLTPVGRRYRRRAIAGGAVAVFGLLLVVYAQRLP